MNIQQLREQRKAKALAARNLMDKTEGSEWTDENQATYDEILAQITSIDQQIERHEQIMQLEVENTQRADSVAQTFDLATAGAEDIVAQDKEVFNAFLRGGMENLSEKQRTYMAERRRIDNALSTGTGSEGGFTVPAQFGDVLLERMKKFGGVRDLARVIQTENGAPIPWPTVDDTAQEGEIVGENAAVSNQEVTFGTLEIPTYKYSSKSIAVPFELLNDNGIDLEDYIIGLLSRRISRITGKHYATGTGTAQPKGVVVGSGVGPTAAAVAAIGFDDLVELEHSVDPSYRIGENVGYMFNDTTLKLLKKLKDTTGRPLFMPGVDGSAFDTINNRRYAIVQEIADVGASAKSVLFGDFSNYLIRDVPMGIDLFRMTDSKYTEKGQVGFLSFSRHGGGVLDEGAKTGGSGAHSIKHLVHPAA